MRALYALYALYANVTSNVIQSQPASYKRIFGLSGRSYTDTDPR